MVKVIGVKFRNVGKVYYFDPADFPVHYQDHVIVETARGIEYGTVALPQMNLPDDKVAQPLKPIVRIATEEDTQREQDNRQKEKEAYRICKQKIAEHHLEMKLIEAEYTFDNSKVLFYFTADGRIDFRELVKDLASVFRTRIELRQIGVRDETKLLGGYGICGRPLCCHTWLTDFHPVSIKMAKDQNLSLNPSKISGVCGRLMCCLNNEAETYAYLNKGMPSRGDQVTITDGRHGEVQSVNILRQKVKVVIDLGNDEKELDEFDVKDIASYTHSKRSRNGAKNRAGKPEKQEKDAGTRGNGRKDLKNAPAPSENGKAQPPCRGKCPNAPKKPRTEEEKIAQAVEAVKIEEIEVEQTVTVQTEERMERRPEKNPDRSAGNEHGNDRGNDRRPRRRRRRNYPKKSREDGSNGSPAAGAPKNRNRNDSHAEKG